MMRMLNPQGSMGLGFKDCHIVALCDKGDVAVMKLYIQSGLNGGIAKENDGIPFNPLFIT